MTEIKRVQVPGQCTLETAKLIELLKAGKPGDEFTDEELTAECRKDTTVGGNGYGYLQSAIKHVAKYHSLQWFRVRGAGKIRCGEGGEILDRTQSGIKGFRRRARKLATGLNAARAQDLDDRGTVRANALAAQLGAIGMMSSNATAKKLEGKAGSVEPELTRERLLAAFTSKSDTE